MAVNCPVTPSGSSGSPGETAIDTSGDVRQAERGRARGAVGRGRDGVAAGDTVARGRDAGRAAGADGRRVARQFVADAPLAGGVNVTRPPATGSIGLLAATVTTSGAKRTGCLAASRGVGEGEPTRLEGADVDSAVDDAGEPALVGGDAGGDEGVVARVDGRAAGQQGHGLGRAAVVAQRCQQGVERRGDGAGQVGADPAGAAVGLADQVVAPGSEGSAGIGPVLAVFPATIVLPRSPWP